MSQTQSLPLYVQISEMLIRDIQAGRLLDGERLPPERNMAEELEISVGTLRKALAELTGQGLLERRQGSGNYVRQGSDSQSVYAFFRLELIEGGGLPTAEVLSVETRDKAGEVPRFGLSDRAHRIRRVRRLNGQLAALEEIWLDASYCDEVRPADMSESLYLFYRRSLGVRIQRAEDRIGVQGCPAWGNGLLGASKFGLGYIIRKSWDQNGDIAEYSRTWFDTDKIQYVSRIK